MYIYRNLTKYSIDDLEKGLSRQLINCSNYVKKKQVHRCVHSWPIIDLYIVYTFLNFGAFEEHSKKVNQISSISVLYSVCPPMEMDEYRGSEGYGFFNQV
jgi:hypothetical protein